MLVISYIDEFKKHTGFDRVEVILLTCLFVASFPHPPAASYPIYSGVQPCHLSSHSSQMAFHFPLNKMPKKELYAFPDNFSASHPTFRLLQHSQLIPL